MNDSHAVAERTDTYLDGTEILRRVEALGPLIEAEADEVDRAGRLTPRLLEALRDAGVFRMAWPARWGGPEMPFEDQVRVVESIAYHDASTAWNVQILIDTGYYGGQLDEATAHELYPSMDLATAGAFYPPVRADRVDGGWRLSGQWPFGSGIYSADRIVGGVHLYENGEQLLGPDGEPEFRVVHLPVEEVELLDTWDVTGLRGTGSTHYRVGEVVVPDERVFSFFETQPVSCPPISRNPMLVGVKLSGVVLGLARRYLDDTIELLRQKPEAQDRYLRVRLAEAESLLGPARAWVYETSRVLTAVLFADEEPSDRQVAEALMATVHAGDAGQRAVELATELVGSRAIYRTSAFERRRRDALTLLAHLGHQHRGLEVPGGMILGSGALPKLA